MNLLTPMNTGRRGRCQGAGTAAGVAIAARRALACRRPGAPLRDQAVLAGLHASDRAVEMVPADDVSATSGSLALHGAEAFDATDPILIARADAAFVYDEAPYEALTNDGHIDAINWTVRNLPHANRYPEQHRWAECAPDGTIRPSTPGAHQRQPEGRPGVTGVFWFAAPNDSLVSQRAAHSGGTWDDAW